MTKTDGVDTTGGFLFERPKSGERAILVEVAVGQRLSQDQIDEFEELALSAGATICASLTARWAPTRSGSMRPYRPWLLPLPP
jgi:hypothetical protein